MSRILFFLLLALLVWFLFFKKKSAGRGEQESGSRGVPPVESMVQCAVCGLRLPEGEAIAEGGRHFCSVEHRDEHPARD